MKRSGILNPALNRALASLGHTDAIVICDCGLPIPDGPERIDLALLPGLPAFRDVLAAILEELQVERALLAQEFETRSPCLHADTLARIDAHASAQGAAVALETLPHEAFKRATQGARAIVRTGECTPYANVILYSGVPF